MTSKLPSFAENKMKRLLLISALAFSAPHAYANDQTGGSGHSANAGLTGGATGAASAATAHSTADAVSGSHAGASVGNTTAAGGAGGRGGRGGNATGGKSSVSIGNVGNGGGGVGSSIGLTVPGGYGSAPCGGGVGLGGLGLSGGGSGGGTLWEFGDCKRMRESSALLQLGFPDAALAELCQIDRVREAFGGKCPGAPVAVERAHYDYPNWCIDHAHDVNGYGVNDSGLWLRNLAECGEDPRGKH